jgi:hypothetical protein
LSDLLRTARNIGRGGWQAASLLRVALGPWTPIGVIQQRLQDPDSLDSTFSTALTGSAPIVRVDRAVCSMLRDDQPASQQTQK